MTATDQSVRGDIRLETGPNPLELLAACAKEERTGELVIAAGEHEARLHLQQGRLAWGTSSGSSFRFAAYICRKCKIDRTALKDVLDECQRTRASLGEVLVRRQLASIEQVRSALGRQVREAIRSLRTQSATSVDFLPRGSGYRSYSRELTFNVAELLEDDEKHASLSTLPGPSTDFVKTTMEALSRSQLGADWLQYINAEGRIHWGEGRSETDPGEYECEKRLLSEGARSAVIRWSGGFLIGLKLQSELGQVWCRAPRGVVLGRAIGALSKALPVRPVQPAEPSTLACVHDELDLPHCTQLLERCASLHAIVVEAEGVLKVASRGVMRREAIVAEVEQASALLKTSPNSDTSVSTHSDTARTYGAFVVGDGTRRAFWLVFEPKSRPGLGWAHLTAATHSSP
ncbi:MAG: DUF4388 domain-containing protein [Sandaracinaceae bacterium]